jgi:hypothetical protein
MAKFKQERFEWIEQYSGHRKPGITASELSVKFGISESSAKAWLIGWVNYYNKQRDIVQHFLTAIPSDSGGETRYKIGPSSWTERAFDSEKEAGFIDHHDFEGIPDRLGLINGTIQTRTDEFTGKRTAAGIRTTKEKLIWIKSLSCVNGVTAREYSSKYSCSIPVACTTLSRWKNKGLLIYDAKSKRYKVSNTAFKTVSFKADVSYENTESLKNRLKLQNASKNSI